MSKSAARECQKCELAGLCEEWGPRRERRELESRVAQQLQLCETVSLESREYGQQLRELAASLQERGAVWRKCERAYSEQMEMQRECELCVG